MDGKGANGAKHVQNYLQNLSNMANQLNNINNLQENPHPNLAKWPFNKASFVSTGGTASNPHILSADGPNVP